MRRALRCVAAILVLLLSVSGSLVASPSTKPEAAPAAGLGPISDALCGRENKQRVRAEALDLLDPAILPTGWGKLKVADFEHWLKAPICLKATPAEVARFERRRRTLAQLRSQIERARTIELVEAALAHLRGRQPRSDEWPDSSECPGCAALRMAEVRVVAITASWPERKRTEDVPIEARLDAAAKRESLLTQLCAAKPSPSARAEIERRFRYYSWTASGARLFEVATLFEQPEVVAGCRGR